MKASTYETPFNKSLPRGRLFILLLILLLTPAKVVLAQQSDNVHYEYDRLNRLTKITYDGSGVVVIFTYDAAGNRTAVQVQGTNLPPSITALVPSSTVVGTAGFLLTVRGSNFINGAVVRWNGSDRSTTYNDSTELTAQLFSSDLASAGSASVTVINPAPLGGTSNAATFTVNPIVDLRIDNVDAKAGRASGGQQIKLTGAFSGLSTVKLGGVSATWSYTNGSTNTSAITVTTPAHSVGAVQIELLPASGSGYSKNNAFAYLPTTFTDDTLVAGVSTAKAQHIIELRQAVDALRAVAGLAPAAWTDAALAQASSIINGVHIQELRSYLEEAAAALGYATQSYTDPSLSGGVFIKRVHIEELRQRIRAIAG